MSTPTTALNPEVLLVDDDELVTRSLSRYLRSARPHWQIRTASCASTALQELRLNPADVCISDVDMSGMNGVELLGAVSSQWPTTIRILYCGDFEQTRKIDGAAVAHQVLSKSSDPNRLIDAVDEALQASLTVPDRTVWRLLNNDQTIPDAPRVFRALERGLADRTTRMQDLTALIASDPDLVERVLALAGSAFLGLPAHLRTLDGAVGWLGLQTVRGLVLNTEVFRCFEGPSVVPRARLISHAFQTAELAARIARDVCPQHTDHAYLASTVHDVGVLVLGTRSPDAYEQVLHHARSEDTPVTYAERALLGVTHADLGAALFDAWNLPRWLADVVRAHHQPPVRGRWTAAAVVFVAAALIDEAFGGARLEPTHCGGLRATETQWTRWRESVGLEA